MKKLFVIAFAFIITSYFANAQTGKQDIALIQSYFGKEKQELVKAYMNLDESTSKVFWTLYDEYEKDRQGLVKDRIKNVMEYIKKFGEINSDASEKIMESILDNDIDLVKLEKKYLGKMKKAIGGIQAVKFFQLENYLRNFVSENIQSEIPAIDKFRKQNQ